jgi:molecular chaperone DnaK
MTENTVLGIDLGTTNSCMTIYQDDGPKVVQNSWGDRRTPSVVTFTGTDILVGKQAVNQRKQYPDRTVEEAKTELKAEYEDWDDSKDNSENELYKYDGTEYRPEDISAEVLRKLKQDAEDFLQTNVDRCIITVPAGFTNGQREATKDAANIAGFEVDRLLHEPSAAAIAYGIDQYEDQTLFVYDLGGGTFDASVLEVGGGVCEANATATTEVGGGDFDDKLRDYVKGEFKQEHGIELEDDREAKQRLMEEVRDKKHELSQREEVTVRVPFIATNSEGEPKDLEVDVTREKLTELIRDQLSQTRQKVKSVIETSDYSKADIDSVLLVGGASRMPQVEELVTDMFDCPVEGGISPEETVALGAGIQAGIESGAVEDFMVIDVTPLSFGIEVKGGLFERVIERSAELPTEVTQTFTTSEDNQRRISVEVYQGEREIAAENHHVGGFVLSGIPPAPAGVPEIKIKFSIDDDGILSVEAADTGTGNSQSLQVSEGLALTGQEIERQKAQARRLSDQDQKFRKHVSTVNAAEEAVSRAKTIISKNDDIISEELANKIQSHIGTVNDALAEVDDISPQNFQGEIDEEQLTTIEEVTDELSTVLQDVGVSVYLNQSGETMQYAPGDTGSEEGGTSSPDDIERARVGDIATDDIEPSPPDDDPFSDLDEDDEDDSQSGAISMTRSGQTEDNSDIQADSGN